MSTELWLRAFFCHCSPGEEFIYVADKKIIREEVKSFVPVVLKEAVIKPILLGFRHCKCWWMSGPLTDGAGDSRRWLGAVLSWFSEAREKIYSKKISVRYGARKRTHRDSRGMNDNQDGNRNMGSFLCVKIQWASHAFPINDAALERWAQHASKMVVMASRCINFSA